MEITHFEQNPPCITIQNHGCEIYFMRHAQSMANVGIEWMIDSPLSEEGIKQAKLAEGKFDLIFCSPCRRTMETLHYSKIAYDKLIIEPTCREMVQTPTSMLLLEQREIFHCEMIENFWIRSAEFQRKLEETCLQYRTSVKKSDQSHNVVSEVKPIKILIISHGFFFNAWFRRGCYTTPENAKIIRIC